MGSPQLSTIKNALVLSARLCLEQLFLVFLQVNHNIMKNKVKDHYTDTKTIRMSPRFAHYSHKRLSSNV